MKIFTKWLGDQSEKLAAQFLKKNGYKIVGRNVTSKLGEIDIIAKIRSNLIFVEVKALSHSDSFVPEDHFEWKKRRKLIMLGRSYLSKMTQEIDARFDLITVVKKGSDYFIEHYENVIQE